MYEWYILHHSWPKFFNIAGHDNRFTHTAYAIAVASATYFIIDEIKIRIEKFQTGILIKSLYKIKAAIKCVCVFMYQWNGHLAFILYYILQDWKHYDGQPSTSFSTLHTWDGRESYWKMREMRWQKRWHHGMSTMVFLRHFCTWNAKWKKKS